MKRYRLLAIAGVGIAATLVGLLVFGNLNRNLVYYLTPDEAVAARGLPGRSPLPARRPGSRRQRPTRPPRPAIRGGFENRAYQPVG
jgi:hypothetical protein